MKHKQFRYLTFLLVTMLSITIASADATYYPVGDFNNFNNNTLGFYRCKQETETSDVIRKAYLKLPTSVQPNSKSDETSFCYDDNTSTVK
ncbi:MAG: hypothetical protein ACOYJG_10035 [Prevotella sp.]|jgi:hypothetical protein